MKRNILYQLLDKQPHPLLAALLEIGGPIAFWPMNDLASIQIEDGFWKALGYDESPQTAAKYWLKLLLPEQQQILEQASTEQQSLVLHYQTNQPQEWPVVLVGLEGKTKTYCLLVHKGSPKPIALVSSSLLQQLSLPLWQISKDFKLEYMNSWGLQLFGLRPERDYGKVLSEIIHPDDLKKVELDWQEALTHLQPSQMDQRLRLANGQYEWFRFSAHPLFDEQGQLKAWIGVSIHVHLEKMATLAAQQNQRLLNRLTEEIPGTVYLMKMDPQGQFSFPFVSSGILKMGIEEMAKKLLNNQLVSFDRIIEADREAIKESLELSARALSPSYFEYRIIDDAGELRWHRAQSTPERRPDGSIVWYGLFQDVTEERQQTKALRQSQELLQKLTNRIPGAVYLIEQKPDGQLNFSFISEGIKKMHPNLNPDEITRDFRAGLDVLYPPDVIHFLQHIERAKRLREEVDVTYRVLREDGEIRWHRANALPEVKPGEKIYWYGVFQDITEQKRREEELRKLAAAAKSTHDALLTAQNDGQITWANAACFHILGETPQLLMQSNILTILSKLQTDEEQQQSIQKALKQNSDFQTRVCLQIDSQTAKWVDLHISAMKDEQHQQLHYLLIVIHDVTDLIERQQKLQKFLDITTSQNERLRSFTNIVSHNIRSHTANITALISLLKDPGQEQHAHIDMLHLTAKKLDETIHHLNEVLAIHQNTNKSKSKCNLFEEVSRALTVLRHKIEATQAFIEVNIPQNLSIRCISSYLYSILVNLIDNAIKYRTPDRPCRVHIYTEQREQEILLAVADNGLGIDLALQGSKLFNFYATFHGNEDARGLGLYLAKNQAEAMRGRIEAESQVGKGSIFKVYLPWS